MIWQTKTLAHALGDKGCGLTIDGFKEKQSLPLLQWICAVPVTPTDDSGEQLFTEIQAALVERGFIPIHDDFAPGHVGLSNAFKRETECPYNPAACSGPHIVITGVGHFDPTASQWSGNAA